MGPGVWGLLRATSSLVCGLENDNREVARDDIIPTTLAQNKERGKKGIERKRLTEIGREDGGREEETQKGSDRKTMLEKGTRIEGYYP